MTDSLERALRRFRADADRLGIPTHLPGDGLPALPTARQLHDCVSVVESGRGGSIDELAGQLLAVGQDGDPALLAETEALLLRAHPRLWLGLDRATRYAWWRAPRWSALAVRRLARGKPSLLELTVAAFHPDGHVREAAVARLSELDDLHALPVLTLRAADWVPQVRDRARSALERRLTQPSRAVFVTTAAVALALRDRREGRWLADRVEAVFQQGPTELLAAGLAATDWRTRRTAHLVGLAAGRLDLAQLLHAAEHDGDLPTRSRCAEAAVRAAVAAGTVELVRPLLSSGTATVRADAVNVLARRGDVATALAALVDRNPIVRAVAQAALRHAGQDPAARYRRLVAAPAPGPGAIAGLGETGAAEDASLISGWLAHPRPRGRAEAVRALRRLGAASPDTVFHMLSDPSGAVTRQVTTTLRPWASELDLPRLRELLAADSPQHVRMAAYRLLHARDTWTRLLIDIELLTDASAPMRGRARNDLATWLAHEAVTTYSMPRGSTAEVLAEQLSAVEGLLEPGRVKLLRFHLGLTRPSTA